jgi:cell filamentation protein
LARSASEDPYVYPGTGVLRNHFDVRDQEDLADLEAQFTAARLLQLQRSPVKGGFDLGHYADTHHAMFKDVYPFAGEFRTVDISKWSEERQDVTVFLPAEIVVPWLNRHLNEQVVKQNGFRGLGRDEFIERTARLYVDLNAFHPFREGNGRTQREFVRTLALNAGYQLDWTRVGKDDLLRATIRTGFDPTKKDRSLHVELAKTVVNNTPDLSLQQKWDRYMGRAAEASAVRGSPGPEWKGTLPEALRASERAAAAPVAFVSSDWKTHARVRVQSADQLVAILEKVGPETRSAAVYRVRDDGTIHNSATGRDEYLRVDANAARYPRALRQAVEAHFGRSAPKRPPTGPDVDDP